MTREAFKARVTEILQSKGAALTEVTDDQRVVGVKCKANGADFEIAYLLEQTTPEAVRAIIVDAVIRFKPPRAAGKSA